MLEELDLLSNINLKFVSQTQQQKFKKHLLVVYKEEIKLTVN